MTVPLSCLKFLYVYPWFPGAGVEGGGGGRTPKLQQVYKILQRAVYSSVLHSLLPRMLNSSCNKIPFLRSAYSCMGVRELNMQIAPLKMKSCTTCAFFAALLTPTPFLETTEGSSLPESIL